jgi:membrane associated rhomboid family serine protease
MIPLRDNINTKTRGWITWCLILLNCYFFSFEIRQQNPAALEQFIRHWSVVPLRFWADLGAQWWTLLTAAFLHAGWAHLFGNMLFLFVFGPSVEDRMGHGMFLFFYLLVGMTSNAAQGYLSSGSSLPMLGASGAIAGVLGAYFFYYPYARIATLIPLFIFSRIVEIPAFIFLGFWFLMQALEGTRTLSLGVKTMQSMGGVAWWAHASGFISGLLLGPAFAKKKGRPN